MYIFSKKLSNKRRIAKMLVAAFFMLVLTLSLVFGAVSLGHSAGANSAYAYSSTGVIDNIYLGGGKFDRGNLDKLAAKAGYTSGVDDLVTAAAAFNYTTEKPGFKTSEDFGDTVVNFGTYTYGGVERELSWLPTFISKSDGGDVILTLWLAGTDSANGTLSDQEVSTFSDGTFSASGTANPSSNNYSTSYIRAVTLNNGGTYYGNYADGTVQIVGTGDGDIHENTYTPTNDNKFAQFTTGDLKQYVASPNDVGWQKNASKLVNDPMWNGSVGHYTPTGWLNDKLWLPSAYEVYSSQIDDDSTVGVDPTKEDGGLWKTGNGSAEGRAKRSNSASSFLRTGLINNPHRVNVLISDGNIDHIRVHGNNAVRPALHLNLTKAAANSFNTVDNIYDQTNGKFSGANLNALANAANFADLNTMIRYAKDGMQPNKTSQDFGDTVVNFGTYTFGGVQRDLTWIPSYLSTDTNGDAILTLWLAGTDSKNGTVSNQEVSTFSGGGYNNSPDTTPLSNNYDTSKIRTAMLNNAGSYYSGYNNSSNAQATNTLTKTDYTPTNNGTNKYEIFTTGELKDYIVAPQNVSWQANALYMKNDPNWNATGNTQTAAGVDEASYSILGSPTKYTKGWLNDKLWLPSMYETYDSTIFSNGKRRWDFTDNGGLWKTSTAQKSNLAHGWLRSAIPDNCTLAYILGDTGSFVSRNVSTTWAVRPALHLNLNMAATSACSNDAHMSGDEWLSDGTNHWKICTVCGANLSTATHDWNAGEITTAPTCTEEGVKTYTCTTCGATKTEPITKIEHAWGAEWLSNATDHWHECNNCGAESTHTAHTPEAIPAKEATCTETGLTEGSKCSVCGTVIKAQEEVPAKGHTPSPWKHDENEHWKECSTCNEKLDTAGHKWSDWTITKEPTTEETGEKRCSCSVCGQLRVEKLAKLVNDEGGNGSVSDLPDLDDPNKQYELEITVEATNKVYALDGTSKGYNVQLWIVGGETKVEYDKSKELTLSLIVPAEMEEFTLYKLVTGGYEPIDESEYTVENGVLSIRTTLPEEFIFNEAAAATGMPWWVWLVIVLGAALVVVVIIIIVVKTRKKPDPVVVQGSEYDDAALKAQLAEQNKRLEDLENRDDGGFNDPYDGEL